MRYTLRCAYKCIIHNIGLSTITYYYHGLWPYRCAQIFFLLVTPCSTNYLYYTTDVCVCVCVEIKQHGDSSSSGSGVNWFERRGNEIIIIIIKKKTMTTGHWTRRESSNERACELASVIGRRRTSCPVRPYSVRCTSRHLPPRLEPFYTAADQSLSAPAVVVVPPPPVTPLHRRAVRYTW
jgi:hypothetical protein